MKGTHLGEFEELVLLTVGILKGDAYVLSIQADLKRRTGRSASMGALHSALTRLEKKGFLTSGLEGATEDRRGRRKRFYTLTQFGVKVLRQVHDVRADMIKLIPDLAT